MNIEQLFVFFFSLPLAIVCFLSFYSDKNIPRYSTARVTSNIAGIQFCSEAIIYVTGAWWGASSGVANRAKFAKPTVHIAGSIELPAVLPQSQLFSDSRR